MTGLFRKYKNSPLEIRATLWFFICSIIQKGISVITIPIFTRLLSVEEYGVYTGYITWLNLFSTFTTFKLNFGVFNKGINKFGDRKNEYVSTMQGITSVLTISFFVLYILFRNVINSLTELPTLIMVLMIVELLFNPALSFWSLKERYELRYRKVVLISIAIAVTNPILGIIAVTHSQSPAYARIISCILVDVLFCTCVYIRNCIKSKSLFDIEIARFAVLFNLPLIPHYLSEYVIDQSDRIMIQKMCGKYDLGLYGVSYSIGSAIRIFVGSLNSTLIPWMYHRLDGKQYELIRRVINYTLSCISIPIVIFVLFAPEVIRFFAPGVYMDAINVIPSVAGSVFFVFAFGAFGNIEFYFDRNRFTMNISLLCAALNIILNYIGISMYGYLAAAHSTLICYALLAILHMYYTNHVCYSEVRYRMIDSRFVWITTVCILALGVGSSIIYREKYIRYVAIAVMTAFVVTLRKKVFAFFRILKTK